MAKPLTREQYQSAIDSGFTSDQIIEFEKKRLAEPEPVAASTGKVDVLDEMTRRTGQLFGIPYEQPVPTAKSIAESGRPNLAGAYQTARDTFTIPMRYGNAMAFNYPRSILSGMGYDLPKPEAQAAKAAGVAADVAGAVRSPVSKAIAGTFFKPGARLMSKIAGGATGGGLWAPDEGPVNIDKRLGQAAFGALVPTTIAGIQKTGEFTNNAGRWVSKNFGGITDATVGIIKRLGANRVFDPIKARVDYLGSVIAPKAQERIGNAITSVDTEGQQVLKALGVKPEQIEALKGIDPATRQKLQSVLGSSDMNEIGSRIAEIKKAANDQYRKAIPAKAQIRVGGPMLALKKALINQGWIDQQGNELEGAGVVNKTKSILVKIMRHYSKVGPTGEAIAGGAAPISGKQYQNLLSELETAVSGNDKFDRLVFSAQDALRNAASKQISSLGPATKAYADAMKLDELHGVFSKLDNVVGLESKLMSLKNVGRAQLHEQWKTVLGKDIYDDVLAHLANQDFSLTSDLPGAGGGTYASRSGLIRQAVANAARGYYRNVEPVQRMIQSGARRGLSTIRKAAGY